MTKAPFLKTGPTAQAIIEYECKRRGIDKTDVLSKRKTVPLVWHRQEIAASLKDKTSLSYGQIGRIMRRDHTSILHACRVVAKRSEQGLSAMTYEGGKQ